MPKIVHEPGDSVPSVVRVQYVEYFVAKEPAFADKLKDKNVGVKKKDGTIVYFYPDVYDIAAKIHAAGKDATKMSKAHILTVARDHFGLGAVETVSTPPSGDKFDVVLPSVRAMVALALVCEKSRKESDGTIVSALTKIADKYGISDNWENLLTSTVPYVLTLSASQLASLDKDGSQIRDDFQTVIDSYQKLSLSA